MKPGVKGKSREVEDNFNPKKLNATKEDELAARQQALQDGTAGTAPHAFFDPENKLLSDMWSVYLEVDGRQRLLDLVKNNDKEFISMVKEMMKLEAAKIGARRPDGPGGKTVLVVMKGLKDESETKIAVVDGVDMVQIRDSLNPNATPKIEVGPSLGYLAPEDQK